MGAVRSGVICVSAVVIVIIRDYKCCSSDIGCCYMVSPYTEPYAL